MGQVLEKIRSTGNDQILLTERGTQFGYNNLVVDMRSFAVMAELGYPMVFDATHSVQLPGSQGSCSGGQRQHVPNLLYAAVAAGADGVFLEVHENPDEALCDGPNSLPLTQLPELLRKLVRVTGRYARVSLRGLRGDAGRRENGLRHKAQASEGAMR